MAVAKGAFDPHGIQLELPNIINPLIARLAARRSTR
jgi:hypothetical protein